MNTIPHLRYRRLLAMLLSIAMLLSMNSYVLADDTIVSSPSAGDFDPPAPGSCAHSTIDCMGTCIDCGTTGLAAGNLHDWPDFYNCLNDTQHWMQCQNCGEAMGRERHYYACDADSPVCSVCGMTNLSIDYVNHMGNAWWTNYAWDTTQHWNVCDACDEKPNLAEHYISCATGVCIICGATDVEGDMRSHSVDYSVYSYDENNHWNVCAGCDEQVNATSHAVDCTTGACIDCGAVGVVGYITHNYDWETYLHDDTYHWIECTGCGEKINYNRHTKYCVTGACDSCGATDVTFYAYSHEYIDSSTYVYDATQHWRECTGCDEKIYAAAHLINCAIDTCTYCGAPGVESENRMHNWDYSAYGYNEDYHWNPCTGCDAMFEEGVHEIDCLTGKCVTCGMENAAGETVHIFDSAVYQYDEASHWQICTACGSNINVAAHVGSCQDATDCIVCGAEEIVSETSGHSWNEWQIGDMIHWSTCSLCGEDFSDEHNAPCNSDNICQVCGAKDMPWMRWEHGNISDNKYGADEYGHGLSCDRKDCKWGNYESHTVSCSNPIVCMICGYENVRTTSAIMEHNYGDWQYDDKHHWSECECGEVSRSTHRASCLSGDACYTCGAENVTLEAVGHVATEFWGRSVAGHFGVCTYCGEQIGNLEPHYTYCGSLGEMCVGCSMMRTSANGISLEIQHVNYDGYQYDENSHWFECRGCGEKIEAPHELSCVDGRCLICGAVNAQGEMTHSRWGTYVWDADYHWLVCNVCDEKFEIAPHEPDANGNCACGATGLTPATPTPVPTSEPTATPTAEPTATPTAEPTVTPTAEPTATPTAEPTATPTAEPTATPTAEPTATPTAEPTATPTAEPTATPTATPTAEPTATPTAEPTATPTAEPTATPTAEPTATPTAEPTATPTAEPTATPTAEPTATPTAEPTATPTAEPTATPTAEPTATPTAESTPVPVVKPTAEPTMEPTLAPAPVIVPEKVENKEIEVLEQEINKAVDNIIAEIKAAVKAESEAASEGEAEAEVEVEVKIEVPVEPLKEAVGEETYEQIVQMPVHEKIVVLLSVLGDSTGQTNLLEDTGMTISEESKTVVEKVIQSVSGMNEESTAAFQQMLEESFPKQEVTLDDKEFVYYLIPMYVTINDVTQVKYYAFCFDKQAGKWLFTIIEEGMDVINAIKQDQQSAEDESAE